MPLINLKTDLKSLKYGKDRIDGGSSNQPYITRNIPEGFSSLGVLDNDFLLRGGITAISESGKDILRLSKMFTDLKSPNGLLFVAKQNLLSRVSPRTQTSNIINSGVYTPLSTLAQAGVNFVGGHLNKQGLNPFEQTGAYSTNLNLYGVKVKPNQPTEDNRLVAIYNNITTNRAVSNWNFTGIDINTGVNVLAYNGGPGSNLGVGKTNIRFADQRTGVTNPNYKGITYLKTVNESNNQVGGLQVNVNQPWTKSSEFGLPSLNVNSSQLGSLNNTWYSGSITWTAHQDTSKLNLSQIQGVSYKYSQVFPQSKEILYAPLDNNSVYNSGSTFPDNTNPLNFDNGTITYSQTQLNQAQSYRTTGRVEDFRKTLRESLKGKSKENNTNSGQLTNSPNYVDKRIEVRNQLGDPGNRKGKSYSSYTKGPVNTSTGKSTGPLDKINASPVGADPTKYNDLVTFNIIPIDGKGAMTFRAFLGSISDSYSSETNSIQYAGRGEKFYTYTGFDRKVSLSWTVAAQSKAELIPMYKKLSYLASNLAPIYKGGFMQGPLVKLTVGGYFHQLPGYINSLTYEMGEDSPWEIQIDDNGNVDRSVSELSHIIKVTGFSFTPIPNYLPQKGANFIDLWNGQESLWKKK